MILSRLRKNLSFLTRRTRLSRSLTLFYEDHGEFKTVEPLAAVARERGYEVSFSDDLLKPAEIGVFPSQNVSPTNARFSVVMLHDLGEVQWPEAPSREPNLWTVSPWNAFDIGVLPGRAWSQCWQSVSGQSIARPRLGVFEVGWPKADHVFKAPAEFAGKVENLRKALRLRDRPSVLYAPSWENDGKQDDVVRALLGLPVNLIVKQAHWPDQELDIREMTNQQLSLADNIYFADPKTDIMECLALSSMVISDESNCLAEALLFDLPPISVTDWLIPGIGGWAPRFADAPPFALKTVRASVRATVEEVLRDQTDLGSRMRLQRDFYFGNLGRGASLVMDLLDSVLTGVPWPIPPLKPQAVDVVDVEEGSGEILPVPVIEDYGPRRIQAGVPFNTQPSGKSALWFRVRNATYPTTVVFDSHELRTAVAADGCTVSAIVPDYLFRSSGEHTLFLRGRTARNISEPVRFVVE